MGKEPEELETPEEPEVPEEPETSEEPEEPQDPQEVIAGLQTALEAERTKSKNLEDLNALYKANQPQRPQPQQPQQPVDPAFAGLDDDDVITVREMKKIMDVKTQQVGQAFSEIDMASRHADYHTVIEKHLPKVVNKNPTLIMAIKTSNNPFVLAYELGKTDPDYKGGGDGGGAKDTPKGGAGDDINKIIKNAAKPGSASSVGARRGLTQVGVYQNMTDDDIEKRIAEIKRRE